MDSHFSQMKYRAYDAVNYAKSFPKKYFPFDLSSSWMLVIPTKIIF